MTGNKVIWFVYGFITILAVVFLGFEHSRIADFHIYLQAAQNLFEHENIYNRLYGKSEMLPYMGSPTLALFIYPISKLGLAPAAIIWKLINILLLVRIGWLLSLYLNDFRLDQNKTKVLFLLTVFSLSFLIYTNFHLVQFTIFLLFCVLEGMYQIRMKNPLIGEVVIGMGILTKLLPVVLIPYLLYRGYWKNVLWIVLVIVGLVLLPAVFIGFEKNMALNHEWLMSISPFKDRNIFDVDTRSIHGIASLISTLTLEGIGNNFSLDVKRNLVNLNPEVVKALIIGSKVILVLGALYVLRSKRIFKDQSKKLYQLWELSYILIVTPLIFPQQRIYAFLYILPAIVYLWFGFISHAKLRNPFVISLYAIGILILNLELILGHFREYYWHFKTLTYGVLIVLGLLLWLSPQKVITQDSLD